MFCGSGFICVDLSVNVDNHIGPVFLMCIDLFVQMLIYLGSLIWEWVTVHELRLGMSTNKVCLSGCMGISPNGLCGAWSEGKHGGDFCLTPLSCFQCYELINKTKLYFR